MSKPPTTPTPTPEPKRTRDKFALATGALRRLEALDTEEERALKEAPADIKRRFAAKRDAVVSGLSDEARELVIRMRLSGTTQAGAE